MDGGTNDPANPDTFNIENQTFTLAKPHKYGYKFTGWFYEDKPITSVNPELNRNITLIAKWEIDADSTCFSFEDNYVITGLKDESVKDLEIPDYVTAITEYAFIPYSDITSLRFSQGSKCTSIGNYAFSSTSLTYVELPASLEYLGDCAFYNCYSLEEVKFADNSKLKVINQGAFSDCAITVITIPASVKEVQTGAIAGCTALKQVIFEKGSLLQRIEDYNFVQCKALEKIVIPASVTYIGTTYEYTLSDLYFEGNADSWTGVEGGAAFTENSTVHFYSETKPSEEGNYWHYVDNVVTEW